MKKRSDDVLNEDYPSSRFRVYCSMWRISQKRKERWSSWKQVFVFLTKIWRLILSSFISRWQQDPYFLRFCVPRYKIRKFVSFRCIKYIDMVYRRRFRNCRISRIFVISVSFINALSLKNVTKDLPKKQMLK